jgi:hypothetical protein
MDTNTDDNVQNSDPLLDIYLKLAASVLQYMEEQGRDRTNCGELIEICTLLNGAIESRPPSHPPCVFEVPLKYWTPGLKSSPYDR